MACYDARARHVLEACRDLGLRVPDDVALMGVDNDPIMCELAHPPLDQRGTGLFPPGLRGGRAAGPHDGRPQAGEAERYRIPPAGLVARQSTDLLAMDNPQVVAAVRMIRQRACEGLTVEQIVRELAVSRSHVGQALQGDLKQYCA